MFFSESVIDVAGILTVTTQLAVRAPLSLVAVIVAVPTETAVTLPVGSTLATSGLFEVHVTPLKVALPGLSVAERMEVAPILSGSEYVFRVIDFTGTKSGLTETVHTALILPFEFETVILAEPVFTPVMRPSALTKAMEVSDELHFNSVLVAFEGVSEGSSRIVAPTATLAKERRLMAVG